MTGGRGMMEIFNIFVAVLVAMVGHTIHGSIFWSIVDFLFWPIALIKWFVCHEITMDVIRRTFSWFF